MENKDNKYKFSKFNFIFKGKGEKYILYNSSSGVLAALSVSNFRKLNEFIKGKVGNFDGKLLNNLINARFILKDSIDELKEFKVARGIRKFKTNELILTIVPTMDCNFRCQYCYQDVSGNPKDRNPDRMSLKIQDRIVKAVEKRGNMINDLSVKWYGGEPLLSLDIIESLSENFIRLSKKFNFSYHSNMSTNGFLLTKGVIEKLLLYNVKKYQISFDGLPEIHNQRRIHKDGIPTFDRIYTNLKIFKEFRENFNVSIRVHFDKNNHDGLDRLIEMFGREFSNDKRFKVYFRPYHSIKRTILKKCGFETPHTNGASEITRELSKKAVNKNLNIQHPINIEPKFFYCTSELYHYFMINYNGDLFMCTNTLDKELKIGEVTNSGDFKIFQEKRTPWLARDPLEEEKCRKCNLLPLCAGGCVLTKIKSGKTECFNAKSNFKKILRLSIK